MFEVVFWAGVAVVVGGIALWEMFSVMPRDEYWVRFNLWLDRLMYDEDMTFEEWESDTPGGEED